MTVEMGSQGATARRNKPLPRLSSPGEVSWSHVHPERDDGSAPEVFSVLRPYLRRDGSGRVYLDPKDLGVVIQVVIAWARGISQRKEKEWTDRQIVAFLQAHDLIDRKANPEALILQNAPYANPRCLAALRKAAGWSPGRVAQLLAERGFPNIHPVVIGSMEIGRVRVRGHLLAALASIFQVSAEYLLGFSEAERKAITGGGATVVSPSRTRSEALPAPRPGSPGGPRSGSGPVADPKRLTAACRFCDLSVRGLADALGVHRNTVLNWISGRVPLVGERLQQVARELTVASGPP